MSARDASRIAEARRKLLEKRLQAARQRDAAPPPIPPHPAGELAPATLGQQGLWTVQQMAPQSAAYNMASAARIEGRIDTNTTDALRRALETVIGRHAALRTRFRWVDGALWQEVAPPGPVPLDIIDVTPDSIDAEMRRRVHQPFDLADGHLFRAYLLCESETSAVLLLVMHHIIGDKWSLEVLFWRELAACYAAYIARTDPDLPAVSAQFTDFAAWQMNKIGTPDNDRQSAYWRDTLADAPDRLDLPLDRPRPARQSYAGEVLYATLSAEQTARLRALSREADSTPFNVLLAVYVLLLHRLSRQDDLVIGTALDMRRHAQLEHTIGYFLNTVALRHTLDDAVTFRAVLAAVGRGMLDAFAHSDVEFEQVLSALDVRRDPSTNPVFQTMFVMWDAQHPLPDFPGLTVHRFKIDPDIAKFDLTLYAQINPDDSLMLAVEYATDLFERETMQRLLRVYETLLDSALSMPDAPAASLGWLPDEQRALLLDQWPQTSAPYPVDACIHDLIAAQPAGAIAVRQGDNTLTYGDLIGRASRIAHTLNERGTGPNVAVGVLAERSPEMLVGIVAALLAGAAYVPIDPAYPAERVQYTLRDAGVSLLLTQAHLHPELPDDVTRIDIAADDAAPYPAPPQTGVTPDDLAYIIYTSGSTGQPKGVRVTHRNLVHSTTARFQVYEAPLERFLLLSSFAFDSSLAGIFWSLCSGGTLCLPPHNAERDVPQIARLIAEYAVTHLLALPSLYGILLDFAASGSLDTLTSLKTVIVAGEACPPALVTAHHARLPDTRLYNEYGPTEGTVWATVSALTPGEDRVPIGRAIPNVQTYIVDDRLQPVPIGVPGELLIGGAGITPGYHNRPELTAARFIANPFGAGRLYHTGDLVRYRPDGNIDFLGRVDQQLKISGYRVEPGEIEAVLRAQAPVRDAVVIAHDTCSGPQLHAFVVAGAGVDPAALRDALRDHLPRYMIPAQVHRLDHLPRTPNGKIDRAALQDRITLSSLPEPTQTAEAADDIEARLLALWADLLGVPVVDKDADFFDMGGHSLLAIRLFARLNVEFEPTLPVSTIFEAPTIRKLAAALRDASTAEKTLITLREGGDGVPLYCFQPNRFGVLYYRDFVAAMDTHHPIYGLTWPREHETPSLAEMAAHFAGAIRQQQTGDGPLMLLGLSAAGVVAYEAARLLRDDGLDARVIMFDTQTGDYPQLQPLPHALRQKARLTWAEWHDSTPTQRRELLRHLGWLGRYRLGFQARKRANWLLTKLHLPLIGDSQDADVGGGHVAINRRVKAYFREAGAADVPIRLYRSRLQPIRSRYAWALGWDAYVPAERISVCSVIGPHSQLLKPPYLAAVLHDLQPWLAEQHPQPPDNSAS